MKLLTALPCKRDRNARRHSSKCAGVRRSRRCREVDIQLQSATDADQRAGLLLRKAVLYGVFGRFDDARRQIGLALKQGSTNPSLQLKVDFIRASLSDQEDLPDKALVHLTAVLS